MTTKETPPLGPSAAALPKRRICKYTGCRRKFTPHRQDHHFCRKACRYAHHKFGSAFGTLSKQGIDRLVRIASEELVKKLPKLLGARQRRLEERVEKFSVALTGFGEVLIDLQRRISTLERASPDTAESAGDKAAHARRVMDLAMTALNRQ